MVSFLSWLNFGGYLLENEGMDLVTLSFQKTKSSACKNKMKWKASDYWFHTLKYEDAGLFNSSHTSHIQFSQFFFIWKKVIVYFNHIG